MVGVSEGAQSLLSTPSAGSETVTIPAVEYAALCRLRDSLRPFPPRPSRSPIARDAELAALVLDCARSGMILRQTRAACAARFGERRTPSMSAIHRFIAAARKAQAQVLAKL